MEIVVATTIFAIVAAAMMSLFNYTLKINRKTEALRQASQGMRNLVEFIVKEVRNGQIDYSVINGTVIAPLQPWTAANSPCPVSSSGVGNANSNTATIYGRSNVGLTGKADNALGIITTDDDRECIYLADKNGNPVSYSSSTPFNGAQLMMNKNGNIYSLDPSNFTVAYAQFGVQPLYDPYTTTPSPAKLQPMVQMEFEFIVTLPTGETYPIYYQTAASTGHYDVP